MTKKYKKRAEADVGLMFVAYNLRRIFNILDQNTIREYLKIVMDCLLLITDLLKDKLRYFPRLKYLNKFYRSFINTSVNHLNLTRNLT